MRNDMNEAASPRIAIIGSGMAGLTCARALADAGLAPVIFDKGRAPGGRLSRRRSREGLEFDHGAQSVTAETAAFGAFLDQAIAEGHAALWAPDGDTDPAQRRVVGVPGMASLLDPLRHGLEIRQDIRVTSLVENTDDVVLHTAETARAFDMVVVTAPVVQVRDICAHDQAFLDRLTHVEMEPCWTFMGAFKAGMGTRKAGRTAPFTCLQDADDVMSWIALNSTKPGRDRERECWVVQASAAWSVENLEREADDIAEQLGRRLCDRIGCDPAEFQYARAHRWRYAKVKTPLGESFVRSNGRRILAGGDWCLGPLAEHAYLSGQAIAQAVLEALE
ncbi:MAG: NAD(P)-binding protein [Paracoccaceae bacterium]